MSTSSKAGQNISNVHKGFECAYVCAACLAKSCILFEIVYFPNEIILYRYLKEFGFGKVCRVVGWNIGNLKND